MGPILIFDKSALQSFSENDAVWLHSFYSANIIPPFFMETLADLEKEVRRGRTPEAVVGNLAMKTAPMGARPNVHHYALCREDLVGNSVEMRGVPVISGGQTVVTANGSAVVFKQAPEEEALRRWQKGEFLEVERSFARAWRAALSALDLGRTKGAFARHPRPRSFGEAKELAVRILDQDGHRYETLSMALAAFEVPTERHQEIRSRWKKAGGPPLRSFAPYAAHVLTVEIFFGLCLHADLISAERASNRVDIAYLYYLPFCMVFTSNDWLHESVAPLFVGPEQVFLKGSDLKGDLAKLDAHYSTLPEETRSQGVMKFAQWPPTEGDFLTTALWDRLMSPSWRKSAAGTGLPMSEKHQAALLELVKKFTTGTQSSGPIDIATAGAMVVESKVPVQLGKWRLMPPGLERDPPE